MREIADELEASFKFPNCPLGVDGTMIELLDRPRERQEGLPANTAQQDFFCRFVT